MDKSKISIEMNFCRRCGTKLRHRQGPMYVCGQDHTVFANASPAVGLWLLNEKGGVLVIERAIDPGKGLYDAPGGFCDDAETAEQAIAREVQEEINLNPEDYTAPEFILTEIDAYDFRGEVLPVLSVMFFARVTSDKQPVACDDAATVQWMPLQDVELEKVYFPAVRRALEQLKSRA